MRALAFALAGSFVLGAAAFAGQGEDVDAVETPVVYAVETPFQGSRVVIHQDPDGLSAAHRPYDGQASPLDPGADADGGPDALRWRFAAPRTGGALAKYNAEMLEVIAADPLERGVRYVDDSPRAERFDPAEHDPGDAWSAAEIDATLARGEDDRTVAGLQTRHHVLTVTYEFTTYDEDGEPAGVEQREHVQELWLAPALPYSPLQLVPGLTYGYALSGSGKTLIDMAVLAAIEPQLSDLGAVVRTAQPEPRDWGGIDGPVVLEISEPRAAEPLELPAVESAPVVPERLFDAVVGPLFIAEMLQNGAAVSSAGEGAFSAQGSAPVDFSQARSAFRLTSADDFALAVAAGGSEGPRGLLVIMRPVNGVPAAGDYQTASRTGSASELEAMSADALAARTQRFQGFGLIEHEGVTYVLTGFASGGVSIEAAGDGEVRGSLEGAMNAVRVDTGQVIEPVPVAVEFSAVEGLDDFYFRSPESRFLD